MPSSKHTPEPWIFDLTEYPSVHEKGGDAVCQMGYGDGDTMPNADANAARIVACVNACAGMADPAAAIRTLLELVAEQSRWDCDCDLPGLGEDGIIECRGCRARAALEGLGGSDA